MSQEPEKKHVLIYLVSIIHWVGTFTAIGLIHSLFGLPAIVLVSLIILAFLVLPPIFRIVDDKDLQDDE